MSRSLRQKPAAKAVLPELTEKVMSLLKNSKKKDNNHDTDIIVQIQVQ